MSYANMDHGEWLQKKVTFKLNDFHLCVADIIGITAGGIYNAPINWRSAEFGDGYMIVNWKDPKFATWDFSHLTILVFLAHTARIRVDVSPVAPRIMRVSFYRRGHEGGIGRRHPNLAEAVAAFEAMVPADHRVRYVPSAQSDHNDD